MPANYPYPQCWKTTQSYDIDFVGSVKYMQIGKVKYGYHRFGPLVDKKGGKPPVVFIPGFGTVMYIWPIPLIQRLAYDREVIMFDYPGVGASKNVSGTINYQVEDLAGSVMAFIRGLKLKTQPDILGWSLGGMVALAMVANNGPELGNILVYSGSAGGNESFAPPQATWEGFLKVRRNDNPEFVKYFFPQGAKDAGVCSLYASWNSFYRSKNTRVDRLTIKGEDVLIRQAVAMGNFYRTRTVWDKLRAVTNRVMMLHGVEDVIVPVKNAPVAARRIVGSWLVTIPEAGHGVLFENVQAAIFTSLEFFGQSQGRFPADQLTWYSYGRNIPDGTPLISEAEIISIIGRPAGAVTLPGKPRANPLPGLAREREGASPAVPTPADPVPKPATGVPATPDAKPAASPSPAPTKTVKIIDTPLFKVEFTKG